jgi:hypothetical protein
MATAAPVKTQIPRDPLSTDVRGVHAELRASIARLLTSLPQPILRPRDLRDALGLHQTLAWKVFRIVQGTDPLGDIQYIPGPVGFETFLKAAARKGVPASTITEVRTAFDRFHSLIDSRAGDRASLELMLGGLIEEEEGAGGSGDGRSLRRAGFRCASSTWGVQVRTRLLSQILAPSDQDPGLLDIALVRASFGMRRIKPGAVLPISPVVLLDNDGKSRRPQVAVPLDVHGIVGGMPLLKRFCSNPLPEIRVAHGPGGIPEHQLGELSVGGKTGIDMVFGQVHRDAASRFRDEHNPFSNSALTVRIPIETAIVDVWAHDDILRNATPRGLLYGELSGVPWYEQRPGSAERLSMSEPVEVMGRGLGCSPLLELPQYQRMMGFAFDSLGWNPDQYTLLRLRVEYPVIATAIVVQFDLPPRPQ